MVLLHIIFCNIYCPSIVNVIALSKSISFFATDSVGSLQMVYLSLTDTIVCPLISPYFTDIQLLHKTKKRKITLFSIQNTAWRASSLQKMCLCIMIIRSYMCSVIYEYDNILIIFQVMTD